jgi:uncharacterized protein (DUF885 family)
MKRALRWIGGTLAILVVGVTVLFVHVWYFKPVRIDWFYDRLFVQFALQQPQFLTYLHVLPASLEFYGDELDDASPAQDQRVADLMREGLDTLHRYDRAALDAEARLSYDALDYYLQTNVHGDRWRRHSFPVNQLFGVQSTLPQFLVDAHQVTGAREADAYITRLTRVPRQFDQLIENLADREARNILPPRFTVEKVLAQMKGFIAPAPRDNTLYVTFREKLERVPADRIDTAARTRYLERAEAAIAGSVYPAYQRLIDHYTAVSPRATENLGAWSLPDGDAYYAWCVRSHTTTDLSPEEVHTLGLADVAEVSARMDAILRAQGYTTGSVGERMRALGSTPSQRFPNTDEGREALLARYRAILDEASQRLPTMFDLKPAFALEVRPVPAYANKTAAAAYYNSPAMDGSRPGIFYANTRDAGETPRFSMRTLAYHEGVPGHHLQASVAQSMTGVPFFRRVLPFTAYGEGWALYAERLAYEMGLEDDPLDNLGRLRDELFRSVRLVVDTGIHYKRWTREQAIDYLRDRTGMADSDVVAEIERYFVQPGQALAYKVGMEKLVALREKSRQALGDKFDVKRFHGEVLQHGALPLVVLERVIDDWIARTRGA